jgi:hypothetical protein
MLVEHYVGSVEMQHDGRLATSRAREIPDGSSALKEKIHEVSKWLGTRSLRVLQQEVLGATG